uniref:Aromatic-L-amino-acid decarboxylase n=1 Tax=Daphnia galeata TaxID=27404 RepID=A0A8J2RWU5_9CRUS|nr:unnamed protein product [Daphnia galeata]
MTQVIATLGTTSSCSFDNIDVLIGPVCNEKQLWLHVDATYAGSAFICEEYRHYMKGFKESYDIHWQIPLGHRFRSLKLWFVMRSYWQRDYVITGDYIRKQVKLVKLAEEFYQMWLVDDRFALYGTCLFPTQGR